MINVSGKISPSELGIYEAISDAALRHVIPFLVVGASARDLILHHAHNTPIIRATGDIDIAVQVNDWADFSKLTSTMLENGFNESDQAQRLISPWGQPVDIVPFGGVEDGKSRIHWMPEGVIQMSVLGFREALDHCDTVRIRDDPVLDIPVATVAGLSLMKIFAWTERSADQRTKDAIDLVYLLKNCERAYSFSEQVYEDLDVLERYDWDITLAAIHLLGKAVQEILSPVSAVVMAALQAGEMTPLVIERLIDDMSRFEDNYERNKLLTTAYFEGMNEA